MREQQHRCTVFSSSPGDGHEVYNMHQRLGPGSICFFVSNPISPFYIIINHS